MALGTQEAEWNEEYLTQREAVAKSIVQMKVARGFFCFRSRFWGGEPGLEVEDRILISDLRRSSLRMGGCALFPVSQGIIERFEPWR